MSFDKYKLSNLLLKAQGDRTRERYAHDAGISLPQLSKFIKMASERPPKPLTLLKLAQAAHNEVTYELLMESCGYTTLISDNQVHESTARYNVTAYCVPVPIVSSLTTGPNGLVLGNHHKYEHVCSSAIQNNYSYFWFPAIGEAMTGDGILPHDLLLVKQQKQVETGSLAVIITDTKNPSLTKIYKTEDTIFYQSVNPSIPPIVASAHDLKHIFIVGKVEEMRRKKL